MGPFTPPVGTPSWGCRGSFCINSSPSFWRFSASNLLFLSCSSASPSAFLSLFLPGPFSCLFSRNFFSRSSPVGNAGGYFCTNSSPTFWWFSASNLLFLSCSSASPSAVLSLFLPGPFSCLFSRNFFSRSCPCLAVLV